MCGSARAGCHQTLSALGTTPQGRPHGCRPPPITNDRRPAADQLRRTALLYRPGLSAGAERRLAARYFHRVLISAGRAPVIVTLRPRPAQTKSFCLRRRRAVAAAAAHNRHSRRATIAHIAAARHRARKNWSINDNLAHGHRSSGVYSSSGVFLCACESSRD